MVDILEERIRRLRLMGESAKRRSSIYSGISEFGPDLGSDSVKLIKEKKIAIISLNSLIFTNK